MLNINEGKYNCRKIKHLKQMKYKQTNMQLAICFHYTFDENCFQTFHLWFFRKWNYGTKQLETEQSL